MPKQSKSYYILILFIVFFFHPSFSFVYNYSQPDENTHNKVANIYVVFENHSLFLFPPLCRMFRTHQPQTKFQPRQSVVGRCEICNFDDWTIQICRHEFSRPNTRKACARMTYVKTKAVNAQATTVKL